MTCSNCECEIHENEPPVKWRGEIICLDCYTSAIDRAYDEGSGK